MSADTRTRFAALLAEPDPDPAEVALLIAAEAYPRLDVRDHLERVEGIAQIAREVGPGDDAVVEALRATGIRGDAGTYDDPRNSFLNEVLDRGRGLPIALSVLTVAVARRVGAEMHGIGMPGHFIVGQPLSGGGVRYLDPFDGWAPLTVPACAALVARTAGVVFREEHLRPVPVRVIASRMLANLRGSYLRRRRLRDALWTVELGLIADPGAPFLERQMAALLAGVGRYDEAEAAAAAYLDGNPAAPDRVATVAHLDAIRRLRGRMN